MDFQSFFSSKFERDFQENLSWATWFETHEDEVSREMLLQFSHILNAHHIWNARLFQAQGEVLEIESDLWDPLPPVYFERLARENYEQSIRYLNFSNTSTKVNYYTENESVYEVKSLDILQHILMHSTHHRAQLILLVKSAGLPLPFKKELGLI